MQTLSNMKRESTPAITIKNVSKRFYKQEQATLKELIPALIRGKTAINSFMALNDLSLDVKKGEVIGIIGSNGSGKSTLLKLIAGVTKPTSGEITSHGRIVPLIELGAGFHGELTGRENIYLNGVILGMSRKEIDQKIDAIINFAELSYFIEQPVKHYSSGMYLRLAFSVAVHLDPDIVLIDEILSVGDENFQRRSLNKIQQIISQNVTVVIVSHSLELLGSLCTKLLWIEKGQLRRVGKAHEVIAAYRQEALGQHTHLPIDTKQAGITQHKNFKEWGNKKCLIKEVLMNNQQGKRLILSTGDALSFTVKYENPEQVSPCNVLISIYRLDEVFATGMTTLHDEFTIDTKTHGEVTLEMDDLQLLDGQYFLRITLYGQFEADPYHVWHYAAEFDVQNTKRCGRGLFRPVHAWRQK